MFVFSGVTFPIGVLLYWLTTNLWSMGQQFYTIRRMPAPGSLAEKALEERRLKSGKVHKKFSIPGLSHDDEPKDVPGSSDPEVSEPEGRPKSGQRQQPKRKSRGKPAGQGDARPGTTPPRAKTSGAKTSGAKTSGAKTSGGKPSGAKPSGAKPSGAKPRSQQRDQ
jgi:YidC/Oxa1 family membrane protein insertase